MKRVGVAAIAILVVVAMGVGIRHLMGREKFAPRTAPSGAFAEKIEEPGDARSEISGKYYGLCKKNSIASPEDFRKTVRNDPVLAAHFADFRWESASLGRQDRPVWTYVSYRKDNVIRRTRRPVRLPAGDGYITDGRHVVRTYCCNDYVIAPPPEEVAAASPGTPVERVDAPPRRASGAAVDPPYHPLDDSPAKVVESFEDHPGQPRRYPYPPTYFSTHPPPPPHGTYSSSTVNPPPPVVAPEPGTIYLVGMAVGAYGLFRLIRRRRFTLR